MSRQKQLLAILAGLFVLALAYAFWATPRQQRVAATDEPRAVRRPVVESPVEAPAEGTRVRLDLLSRERERFAGYQRDIFNYPRPAPPPPPKTVKAPVMPPPPPPPIEIPEPAPVTPEVKRELARFTFLGYLEKDGVKTIFLSSGEEIFVVKNGERFGERNEFHVTALTPERLTIQHGEDPRVITIPLVEQAPLVPSVPSRAVQPFPRPEAGSGLPGGRRGDFVPPEEAPMDEEEDLSPPEEGENGFPPVEDSEPPRAGEEGMMENEMLPPGGAVNE